MSCVSHAFASVHCCRVVTCWERTDLLALFGDVYCIFVTFPCGILGPVWYLIVSFPDLCLLSYYELSSEGVKPDKMKLKAISEMPAPTGRKGVMRLLNTVNYLSNSYLTCHKLLNQSDCY